jgi:hypothetical protein
VLYRHSSSLVRSIKGLSAWESNPVIGKFFLKLFDGLRYARIFQRQEWHEGKWESVLRRKRGHIHTSLTFLQTRLLGSFSFLHSSYSNHYYCCYYYYYYYRLCGLVVTVLATDLGVRVRFSAIPHFLRSSGSGTGSTQPREYKWGATWKKK